MQTAIETDIATMIRDVARNPELIVTPDTELEVLGIDSLDFVELLFLVEEKFGIDVPYNANTQDDIPTFTTVRSIAETVRGIIAAKGVVA